MNSSQHQTSASIQESARSLGQALEPFVGCVYFAPECHQAYASLGFAPSSRSVNGVAMPDGPAYFTSRGSLLGQVHGNLVASTFAVFNPAVVAPAVAHGWSLTDAPTIRAVRQSATGAFLHRVLGTDADEPTCAAVAAVLAAGVAATAPEGRPLFAGVTSEPAPIDDPLLHAWFLGDALREARGDSHTAAWIARGFDAVEIGLLTEAYWGLPFKSYVRTRAWSDDQLNAGLDRLASKGLVADGALTEAGYAERERVELDTDLQMTRSIAAMGEGFSSTIAQLRLWSAAVRTAQGYPASGPHDLANARTNS